MIRTSGYYKESNIGEELIPNADFELGSEGWIFKDFKEVDSTSGYIHCVYNGNTGYLYPKDIIEIFPNDLLLMGLSVKPDNYSGTKTLKYVLYPTDKSGTFSYNYYTVTFTIQSNNINNYYRLFSASEIFRDNFNELWGMRVARAVVPRIESKWNNNESIYFRSISLQRIEADKLKLFPLKMIDVSGCSAVNTNYYSDSFLSGIFNEANYVLYIEEIGESGGSNPLTLEVYIESYDVGTGKWFTCAEFEVDISAGGSVEDKTYVKVATAGLGFYQRVRWKASGSGVPGTTWKFKVGVTYKQ